MSPTKKVGLIFCYRGALIDEGQYIDKDIVKYQIRF